LAADAHQSPPNLGRFQNLRRFQGKKGDLAWAQLQEEGRAAVATATTTTTGAGVVGVVADGNSVARLEQPVCGVEEDPVTRTRAS
jgi:hypothetical protein